jgi:hypothetical protein
MGTWLLAIYRGGLLILSVSTLGFFISIFSAVLALDFTAAEVPVLYVDHPCVIQADVKKLVQEPSELIQQVRTTPCQSARSSGKPRLASTGGNREDVEDAGNEVAGEA